MRVRRAGRIRRAGRAGGTGTPAAGRAGAAACPGTGLQVRLAAAEAGAAAGSSYLPIEFTNATRSRCRLSGYPAVALAAGASGRAIGTPAAADPSVRPRPVLLAPGGTAHAWLQVQDAMNYPAAACRPVTAAGLRVAPPGHGAARYLPHPLPACATAPRGRGLLTIEPVQPGAARRGTAG